MSNKMDQIKAAIIDKKTKVVSFDVFDTLVLRPFWFPTDLFMFLDREASKLLHTADIVRFSEFRKKYELEIRDKVAVEGREDVTFSEIYSYIEENSPFPSDVIYALKRLELELELRFCTARKSTIELMNIAKENGKKIIIVSDMYLPTETIRHILKKNDIDCVSAFFVSGVVGLSKGSGNLYRYAAKKMGVKFREIVHIGDNLKTDVIIPRKLNIRSFYYPRTISLLSKGKHGRAYRHAFEQIRSSQSNYHATEELGIRCMLAVAANRIFDNPFISEHKAGDYAYDTSLFGNLALGMYSMAQGIWIYRLTRQTQYDRVLFFSRDGYLPYYAYELIRSIEVENCPAAHYVRSSRKALLPLLLLKDNGSLRSGSHLLYLDHSPESLTHLMEPVLCKNTSTCLKKEMSAAWSKAFHSEIDLVKFMDRLLKNHVDFEKADKCKRGFIAYFEPLMQGRILTYDIGYSLRNEIMLHEYFPDVEIDACFTHGGDDISLRRGVQAGINIHTFFSSTPFVSWLPRELFLTESYPSCVGYTEDGQPLTENKQDIDTIIARMQDEAISYLREFVSTFGEDISWLPMQLANACLPFETFLHSPLLQDRRWVRNLNADNDAASGLRIFQCYDFWRRLRVDYWVANHHIGKYGRYAALCVLLLITDRHDFKKAMKKRLPHRIMRIIEK